MEASMLEGVLQLIGLLFQVFELISGLLDLLQFLWTVLNLIGEMLSLAWQCLRWTARKITAICATAAPVARPEAGDQRLVAAYRKKPEVRPFCVRLDDVQ
jgi:hypothetical protein